MGRLHDANTKAPERLGKFDERCGLPRETLVALNSRFLTKRMAYRILESLEDVIRWRKAGWRVEIKLSNRRTVTRMGTINVRMPLHYAFKIEPRPGDKPVATILLYRWTELILLHELAHLKNYVKDDRFAGHGPKFSAAMRQVIEAVLVNATEKQKAAQPRAATVQVKPTKSCQVLGTLMHTDCTKEWLAEKVGTTVKSLESMVSRLRRDGYSIRFSNGIYSFCV